MYTANQAHIARTLICFATILLSNACTHITTDRITDTTFRKFASEQEFRTYLRDVNEIAEKQDAWWTHADPTLYLHGWANTQVTGNEALSCTPDEEGCQQLEEVVVSASMSSSSSSATTPMSITNVQEGGVDEGDIIKLIDHYLIVLQDGRLFSIDIGHQAGALRLVDRINLYRKAQDHVWYDELLVYGNRLLVLGFNWYTGQSEIVILDMDEQGVFKHNTTYYLQSSDYYSLENYATRLVDGHLIFYTPFYLYELEFSSGNPIEFPKLRRWTARDGYSEWQPLFEVTDVYRPIQPTLSPIVHAVTRCAINAPSEVSCRSTGLIDSEDKEFYVTPEYFYLWVNSSIEEYADDELASCEPDEPTAHLPGLPAMLYRIAHESAETRAVAAHGRPLNQFALEEREEKFYALVEWYPTSCFKWPYDDDLELKLVTVATDSFARRPKHARSSNYLDMPAVPGEYVEARFANDHLLYTGMESARSWLFWGYETAPELTEVAVVPLSEPENYRLLQLGHSGNRLELYGDHAMVNGYSNGSHLDISIIELGRQPKIAGSINIPSVAESEGRSHAFNSLVRASGEGLFAVPTIDMFQYHTMREHTRWPQLPSDLTFVSVDAALQPREAGQLFATDDPIENGYSCEVSCEDWYGNARAVFIGDRIFAISGDELIEGFLHIDTVAEVARIRMTQTLGHRQ